MSYYSSNDYFLFIFLYILHFVAFIHTIFISLLLIIMWMTFGRLCYKNDTLPTTT